MKRGIIFFIVIIFSVMLIYLAFNNEPKQSAKVITVKKDYSYIYQKDIKLEVDLFINEVSQPLHFISNYESLYLMNIDETIKLKVTLDDLIVKHKEKYLNENYYLHVLSLNIPVLNNTFSIQNAYLLIELIDGNQMLLNIGRVSLYYVDEDESDLRWENLSGVKNESIKLSRINEVLILFNDEINNININTIKINEFLNVDYEITNNILAIKIPYEQLLLNRFSIIINYDDNFNLAIKNFPFVEDYLILTNSVSILSVYESS